MIGGVVMVRDKALVVVRDKKRGVVMKWFGGHGVHAYRGREEFAFWNVGDFSKDHADEKVVRESMAEMLKEGNYEDYS
jgi:hypothetical protein